MTQSFDVARTTRALETTLTYANLSVTRLRSPRSKSQYLTVRKNNDWQNLTIRISDHPPRKNRIEPDFDIGPHNPDSLQWTDVILMILNEVQLAPTQAILEFQREINREIRTQEHKRKNMRIRNRKMKTTRMRNCRYRTPSYTR